MTAPSAGSVWIEQQKQQIRQQFVDQLWVALALLALIAMPLSLLRIQQTGWLPVYGLHVVLSILIWLIAAQRHHLPLPLKSAAIIALMMAIGGAGILNFGLAATGAWWLATGVLLASMLFRRRVVIVIAGLNILLVLLMAYGFSTQGLQLSLDLNLYVQSPIAWSNFIVTNLLLIYMLAKAVAARQRMMQAQAQHQFRQWIDDLPLALEVLDHKQQLYYQNAAARNLLGPDQQALCSLQHQALFSASPEGPPLPDADLPSNQALRGDTCQFNELYLPQLRLVSGGQRVLRAWGWPGYLENGRIGFGVAVFEDISRHKQLEQIKNQFVSTVSHELRTPLTAIRGAVGLLQSGALGELSQQSAQMIQLCQQNTERLLFLVNDLLDMQKIEQGKLNFSFVPCRILSLLEQTLAHLRPYADSAQVQLELQTNALDPQLQLDPQRFQQVMVNLLSNAIKFSPAGAVVYIRLRTESERLVIEVQDHGEGIPEAFQPQLFQPFSQADTSTVRQRSGTGLGLSISKTLVEQMQGQISFHSTPGSGTTFALRFPLLQPDSEPK